ncbi:MAG: acyltransferase [Galbitalea sp.]
MSSAPSSVQPSPPDTDRDRLVSLDGLRGLAALIVVFSHLALTFVPFSDVWIVPTANHPPIWSFDWWFTSTPAELLIAGSEAVLVFFVLSGLVVALPVLRKPAFDWAGYFPQRIARLVIPAIASVALAIVWILATSQSTGSSTSLWVAAYRFRGVTLAQVADSVDLLFGGGILNNPLWTLTWEIIFSLLLPIFVVFGLWTRRFWWVVILGCFPLVAIGTMTGDGSFTFLPVFLVGTVLAVRLEETRAWARRHENSRWWNWAAVGVLVVSLLLLDLHWTLWGFLGGPPKFQATATALQFFGAFGLVLLAVIWRPASRLLSTRLFRWLGRISFSLYLVHVPIIIAIDGLFGKSSPLLRIVVSLVIALAIAEAFARFVEQPAHRFSRRLGRASSRILRSRAGQLPESPPSGDGAADSGRGIRPARREP